MKDFNEFAAYLAQHWIAIGGYLILAISSAVKTLPLPGQPFKVYTFFYDWSHQFLNITNTRLASQQTPTPPDSAGKQPSGATNDSH